MSTRRLLFIENVPKPIRRAFEGSESDLSPEIKLWREVAARAILDSLGYTGLNELQPHNKAIIEARQWFQTSKEDVETVFDLAGIEPNSVVPYLLRGSHDDDGRR